MEKGLYEVRIERTNMFFDSWMGVSADLEIKYVFVNNYEAFEKWLEDIYILEVMETELIIVNW